MTANVIPLGDQGRWDHVSVRVEPDRPRIEPDIYTAKTVSLRKNVTRFERMILELDFDVYQGEAGLSPVLATLTMYITLPPKKAPLSPNCRLAQMLSMLNQVRRDRYETLDLSILRDKLWRIQVADTKQDHTGSLKDTEIKPYSTIRRVLSRA